MRALALWLLLAAAPAAAQVSSTEPYSIARAGLTGDDVGALVEAGRGRYVAVGDRLVDVASSTAAGADVVLTQAEGEALARPLLRARLARLRAAAAEGALTAQDRAEARALAVARGAALAWRDLYFLASLNPDADPEAPDPAGAYVPAAPGAELPAGRDMLGVQLRERLDLVDHGDPAQAEGLDMAVRLMLQSPTARELSAEFLKLNRRVKVSFEPLDGVVAGDGAHKYVTGIGGLTSHTAGDWVQINIGYLQTDPRYQFRQIPGVLAHELLGHAYNGARAANAGVSAAMNVWRGDEDAAAVTGWLVQAESAGKAPSDAYLWGYLSDPERYHQGLHLITAYYAESLSPDEAGRPEAAYAERLTRVGARIAQLEAEAADRTDWGAVADHFVKLHGTDPWRFLGLRDELLHPSTAAARVEYGRLLDIRRALTKDLADLKDPVGRAEAADRAKLMRDPFFADAGKRLDVLDARLRAFVAAHEPPPALPTPGITTTVVAPIGRDELRRLYQDDLRDHPEHWPAPPPSAAPSGPKP